MISKYELYQNDAFIGSSHYPIAALVIHNNSDAFGQTIETEGQSSMDGVIGVNSDAAVLLSRQRKDHLLRPITPI